MFFETGFPKVEWDKKATLGSKPNNLATLTQDIDTFANLSAEGKSFTLVSVSYTHLTLPTILLV